MWFAWALAGIRYDDQIVKKTEQISEYRECLGVLLCLNDRHSFVGL